MESAKAMVFDLATEGLEPLKHRIMGITIKTTTEEKIILELYIYVAEIT